MLFRSIAKISFKLRLNQVEVEESLAKVGDIMDNLQRKIKVRNIKNNRNKNQSERFILRMLLNKADRLLSSGRDLISDQFDGSSNIPSSSCASC